MSALIPVAFRDEDGRLKFIKPPVVKGGIWTPKLDARLRILAPDYTAAQIGNILGVSRNAVVGRCHRKGISLSKTLACGREGEAKPARKVARRPPPPSRPRAFAAFGGESDAAKVDAIAASRVAVREAKMAAPSDGWRPARVAFLAIQDGLCKWPLWSAGAPFSEKFFCGNESLPGLPYCQHCAALSYAPRATKSLDKHLGLDKLRSAA